MRGWLGTLTALPMSWHSAATTTSSSALARSASVAVWRQCVSWSVAKPSVISESDSSMLSTRSATRSMCCEVSAPMTAHCSAVDSSMRVNVVAIWASSLSGEGFQHLTRGKGAIVETRTLLHRAAERPCHDLVDGGQELTQLGWRREVLLLGRDRDLLDAVHGRESGDHCFDEFLGRRRTSSDTDGARQLRQFLRRVDAVDGRTSGLVGELFERSGVRRVRGTDDDDGVALRSDRRQG